jgi:hypothetical protein
MNDNAETQNNEMTDSGIVPTGDDLIKKYAHSINRFHQEGGEKMEECGNYILKHFYMDDIELALSRKPNKGIGIREIANHPDIELSFSTLNRAVRIAIQSRFLWDKDFDPSGLTYAQKIQLLSFRKDAKVGLAERIVTEKLTRSQIEAQNPRKQRKPKAQPKEKPVSKFAQTVGSLESLREVDIDLVVGEIAGDHAALDKLRDEADKLGDWVKDLLGKIDANCA